MGADYHLSRRNGRSVSELLSNRIQNFDFAGILASDALEEWRNAERPQIAGDLRNTLELHISFVASAT
ncbi:MAG: hypothetical protein ACYSTY_04990 [Planctomycetota bacterium]